MNLTGALARIAGRSGDVHGAAGAGLDLSAVLAEARRRRRRFATLTTVAAAAAAALIAAGGVVIGSIDATPVPPATTEPSPSPTSSGWGEATTVAAVPACGDPEPQLERPANPSLRISSSPVSGDLRGGSPADQLVEVALSATGLPTGYVLAGQVPVTYALVSGGRVVSAASATWQDAQQPISHDTTALFQPCPGADAAEGPGGVPILTPGAYLLYAVAQLSPQTIAGTTVGGAGALLVASEPSGLRIAGPLTRADPAPALPSCGADASGLAATSADALSLYTTIVPAGGYPTFDGTDPTPAPDQDSFAVAATMSTPFMRVGQDRLSWVAVQGGTVVAQGGTTLPVQGDLAGSLTSGLVPFDLTEPLSGLTDCRTGGALQGAYELWVRADLGLDTAPMLDATDPTVSLIADPVWATTDPQPIPATVPMVGKGATVPDGDAVLMTQQTGPKTWAASATVAGPDSKARARVLDALLAAGFAEVDQGPGSVLSFQGHGLDITVMVGGAAPGGVVPAEWAITAR